MKVHVYFHFDTYMYLLEGIWKTFQTASVHACVGSHAPNFIAEHYLCTCVVRRFVDDFGQHIYSDIL